MGWLSRGNSLISWTGLGRLWGCGQLPEGHRVGRGGERAAALPVCPAPPVPEQERSPGDGWELGCCCRYAAQPMPLWLCLCPDCTARTMAATGAGPRESWGALVGLGNPGASSPPSLGAASSPLLPVPTPEQAEGRQAACRGQLIPDPSSRTQSSGNQALRAQGR